MKGKNERGEKKERRGGKKERGEKELEGKKERRGKKSSIAGLKPATFHSTGNCLQLPPEVELHT